MCNKWDMNDKKNLELQHIHNGKYISKNSFQPPTLLARKIWCPENSSSPLRLEGKVNQLQGNQPPQLFWENARKVPWNWNIHLSCGKFSPFKTVVTVNDFLICKVMKAGCRNYLLWSHQSGTFNLRLLCASRLALGSLCFTCLQSRSIVSPFFRGYWNSQWWEMYLRCLHISTHLSLGICRSCSIM